MDSPLGSELSCTYARNSSTSEPKIGQCIKENEDYVGFTEISSCECSDKNGSHGDIDLDLGLDLTLWINHVESKHAAPQPNPPISRVQSAILGGMEQARIFKIRDFRAPDLSRQDKNMYSDCRNVVDVVEGFKESYQEVIVTQPGPVQCSALGILKENQQETPVSSSNEGKHLAFSWNTTKQFRSLATNHSGIDDLCNLSHDEACQLSSFDHNLTDNHLTAPGDSSITQGEVIGWPPIRLDNLDRGEVIGWPPIRLYRMNSLGSLPKPSGENRQGGAMAGRFVQGQGNSLYVKVTMDGVPIGRKVDINAYGSYESLAEDLENMFQRTTENHLGACTPLGHQHVVKPLGLLDPAADFVLTYEDSEGDCMLATDVPWKMFLHTVKRLRIMKNSGTNDFAQKCSKKRKAT
jgi:auxin-responsive protein IAA